MRRPVCTGRNGGDRGGILFILHGTFVGDEATAFVVGLPLAIPAQSSLSLGYPPVSGARCGG